MENRNTVMQWRVQAWAYETLKEANAARNNGQADDAKRLYQSILDAQRVPAYVHGQAVQALEKMKVEPASASISASEK
jgi:hypothetical protein